VALRDDGLGDGAKMTYDEAKVEVLALIPNEGDLFVRVVDDLLLCVCFAEHGVIFLLYGQSPAYSDKTLGHTLTFELWMRYITSGIMRPATADDVRRNKGISADTLAGRG
jgi:hypothetical protein